MNTYLSGGVRVVLSTLKFFRYAMASYKTIVSLRQYTTISSSRSSGVSTVFLPFGEEKKIFLKNRKIFSTVKASRNVLYPHSKYVELLNTFESQGFSWTDIVQRKVFDYCLINNRSKIASEPMLDYLTYCGRFPTKAYSSLFYFRKNRALKKLARKSITKIHSNRFLKLIDYQPKMLIDQVGYCKDCNSYYQEDCFCNPIISFKPKIWSKDCSKFSKPLVVKAFRSLMLSFKLRKIILNFREKPELLADFKFNRVKSVKSSQYPTIQPEMDNASDAGFGNVKVEHASTTITTNQTTDVLELPNTIDTSNFWVRSSISDSTTSHPETADKWVLNTIFDWLKSHSENTTLVQVNFPSGALLNMQNSATSMMFRQYTYWKGDIHIKIHLNSNAFQVGSLVVAWYYNYHHDGRSDIRLVNKASLFQMPHTIIQASDSNDVEFIIPYRSYKSMLSTVTRSDQDYPMDLGRLIVMVNNPLVLSSTTYEKICGTLYVKFPNSVFSGLRHRYIKPAIQAEMYPIKKIVNVASDVLDTIMPDANRDNPPLVNPAPWLIPQPMQNFATGFDDVENVQVMRLGALAQTPHPKGSSTAELETSIDFVKMQWGFIKTLQWKVSDKSGTILFNVDAAPLMPHDTYPKISYTDDLKKVETGFIMPPVAHLSSMNCYWRGDLEFRLDFVSSMYQTGSLLIAYVPRTNQTTFTRAELISCYNATIDLSFSKRFIFKVPYIADKPWWPRRERHTDGTDTSLAPGKIIIMILNELALMDAVPQALYINIFIRGAPSFEVCVPVSPAYIPMNQPKITKKPSNYLRTRDGYQSETWFDTWRYCPGRAIIRYGKGSDHITQFEGPIDNFTMYEIDTNVTSGRMFCMMKDVTMLTQLTHFCRCIVNNDRDSYIYMTGFDTKIKAQAYLNEWAKSKDPLSNSPQSKMLEVSAGYQSTELTGKVIYFKRVSDIQHENDDAIYLDPSRASLASTQGGLVTFGERFHDLKDYMRRYQLYYIGTVNVEPLTIENSFNVSLRMPISPIGLDYSDELSPCRLAMGGNIQNILSSYRFYRGGLRFRIIAHSAEPTTIYIQHRPDMISTSRKVTIFPDGSVNPDNTILSGYAMNIINTGINSMTTIEIPYYNPANLSLLQVPDFVVKSEMQVYTLGELLFSFSSVKKTKVTLSIFYCIADDFKPSCFVGYMPSYKNANIDIRDPMFCDSMDSSILSSLLGRFSTGRPSIQAEMFAPCGGPKIQPEGIRSYFVNKFYDNASDQVRDKVRKELEETGLMSVMMSFIKEYSKDKMIVIHSAISNLCHVFVNPTISTICMSIFLFLTSIGLISMSYFDKLYQMAVKIYSKIFSGAAETEEAPGIQSEGLYSDAMKEIYSFDTDDWAAFLSSIVGSICLGLGVAYTTTKLPNFANLLFAGVNTFSFAANNLFRFFRNNLIMIQKMFHWVMRRFGKGQPIHELLADDQELFKIWYDDAQQILDPTNAELLKTSSSFISKAYCNAVLAQAIQRKYIESENLDGKFAKGRFSTLNLCSRIIQKRDELIRNRLSPPVRFEPFVVCMYGEPGVGKTHMTQNLGMAMLDKVKYKGEGEIFYTRTPGNAYWNGCLNQPITVYDDFMQITSNEYMYKDIAELILLKSKAVFNPPQAAIEDKHIRYNPLIVFLNTNTAYPRIPNLADDRAWKRRRDILIKVAVKQDYEERTMDEIPNDVKKNYDHLLFCIKSNSINSDAEFVKNPRNGSHHFSYDDMKEYVNTRFFNHFQKESDDYISRVKAVSKFSLDSSESMHEILTRYEKFLHSLNRIKMDPSVIPDLTNISKAMSEVETNSSFPHTLTRLIDNIKQEVGDFADPVLDTTIRAEAGDVEIPRICCHSDFNDTLMYSINPSLDTNGVINNEIPGFFSVNSTSNLYIPEAKCDGRCKWADPIAYVTDMSLWQQNHNWILASRNQTNRPAYFRPKPADIVDIPEIRDLCKPEIKKEASEKWYTTVGRIIKWVLKKSIWILGVVGSVYAIANYSSIYQHASKLPSKLRSSVANAKEYVSQATTSFQNRFSVKPSVEMAYNEPLPKQFRRPIAATQHLIQNEMNDDHRAVIKQLLERNIVFMVCESADGHIQLMRCLGLKGHWMVMLDHYHHFCFKQPDSSKYYLINSTGNQIYFRYSDIMFKQVQNSAIVFAKLPNKFNMFKDITGFFIKQKNTDAIPSYGFMYEFKLDVGCYKSEFFKLRISTKDKIEVPTEIGIPPTNVEKVLTYDQCRKGLCGTVICGDINHINPLLGIHIAGMTDGSGGFGEVLMQETIQMALSGVLVEEPIAIPGLRSEMNGKVFLQSNIIPLGKVPSFYEQKNPAKSKLEHSHCYEKFFPSTYDYPLLHPNDTRLAERFSPLVAGCEHHGNDPIPFEKKWFDMAVSSTRDLILTRVKPSRATTGVLDINEAIIGLPVPGYDSIDFTTSEGFPFTLYRPDGEHDKSWLFEIGLHEEYFFVKDINPLLQITMDEKMQSRVNGIVPPTIFADSLKDQKMPYEKALLPGKTRIISLSPVDFTINFRQYFLDFMVSYQDARFNAEHAVGINKDSIEWTTMVNKLLANSPCIVTGDYSKFGPTLMAEAVEAAFEIIIDWYEKYDPKCTYIDSYVRKIMGIEIMCAKHLMKDFLYQCITGGPSGTAITVHLNNLINKIYIRFCWAYFCDKANGLIPSHLNLCMSDFEKYVCVIFYGDDLIMSVKSNVVEYFNAQIISNILSRYGIKFTDSTKNETVVSYATIFDDCTTFLKSNIVRHPFRYGVYVHKLDQRSVQEISNWVMKSRTPIEAAKQACSATLDNYFGYGEKEYNRLRFKMIEYWASEDDIFSAPTWMELDDRMFGDM